MNPSFTFTTSKALHRPARGRLPLRWLCLLSVSLSAWLLYSQPALLDQDLLYLLASQALTNDGWIASQAIMPRPGFPLVMAGLHAVTGCTMATAAMLIHAAMYALLAACFVATVAAMGGSRRVQLFAAVIILLHPLLLEHRSLLPRELGFWCCALLSLQPLARYCRHPSWSCLWQWLGWLALGSLFRNEALYLILLMPLASFLVIPVRQRRNAGLRILGLSWLVLTMVWFSGLQSWLELADGGLLFEARQAWGSSSTHFQLNGRLGLDPGTGTQDQPWIIAGALLALLAGKLVQGLGWLSALVLLLALRRRAYASIQQPLAQLILLQVSLSLVPLGLYVLASGQLALVDVGLVVLCLLLFLAFALEELWRALQVHWRLLATAVVVLASLKLLFPGYLDAGAEDRQHLLAGAKWLRQQPTNAVLLTNHPRLAWAGGQRVHYVSDVAATLADTTLTARVRYLALQLDADEFSMLYPLSRQPQFELAAEFQGSRGDWLVILENVAL